MRLFHINCLFRDGSNEMPTLFSETNKENLQFFTELHLQKDKVPEHRENNIKFYLNLNENL